MAAGYLRRKALVLRDQLRLIFTVAMLCACHGNFERGPVTGTPTSASRAESAMAGAGIGKAIADYWHRDDPGDQCKELFDDCMAQAAANTFQIDDCDGSCTSIGTGRKRLFPASSIRQPALRSVSGALPNAGGRGLGRPRPSAPGRSAARWTASSSRYKAAGSVAVISMIGPSGPIHNRARCAHRRSECALCLSLVF